MADFFVSWGLTLALCWFFAMAMTAFALIVGRVIALGMYDEEDRWNS